MLSLYVHVPFCVAKCSYCGFYSTAYDRDNAEAFIKALTRESETCQQFFEPHVFDTLYLGGGTPSLLSPELTDSLFDTLRSHFTFDRLLETTIEANPNSISPEKMRVWRERGVNRLSLGIQSFSDEVLAKLGRSHTAHDASEAFKIARDRGFRNISIDLIYGIPGQTMDEWSATLETAVSLHPEHCSLYALSLDEGSRMRRDVESGKADPLDEDVSADQYETAVKRLAAAGYTRYEISNFCVPGFECRHNLNYWHRGEYLGLGPSAWSFYDRRRYRSVSLCKEYIERLAAGRSIVDFEETPTADQEEREVILLRLRTRQGLDLPSFKRAFGEAKLGQLVARMDPLCKAGLMNLQNDTAVLSDRGFLLSNEALSRLVD